MTGKNWHATRTAFRPTKGQTSYEKRLEERKSQTAMKEREKEMREEKESERQVRADMGKFWNSILSLVC